MKAPYILTGFLALICSAGLCFAVFSYGFRLTFDEMSAGEAGMPPAKQVATTIVQVFFFIPNTLRHFFGAGWPVVIGLGIQVVFYTTLIYFPLLRLVKKVVPTR